MLSPVRPVCQGDAKRKLISRVFVVRTSRFRRRDEAQSLLIAGFNGR